MSGYDSTTGIFELTWNKASKYLGFCAHQWHSVKGM
jgi:hypothetical protein